MKQNNFGTPRKWHVVVWSWFVVAITAIILVAAFTAIGTVVVMTALLTIAAIFEWSLSPVYPWAIGTAVLLWIFFTIEYFVRQWKNNKRYKQFLAEAREKAQNEPQSAAPVQEPEQLPKKRLSRQSKRAQ